MRSFCFLGIREEVRGSPLRSPAVLLRLYRSIFGWVMAAGQRRSEGAMANGVFRGGSHDGAGLWYRSATKKISPLSSQRAQRRNRRTHFVLAFFRASAIDFSASGDMM